GEISERAAATKPVGHGRPRLAPWTLRELGRRWHVRFEAIARGPIGVAGRAIVIEEPEPVADAVLGHRIYRHVADRGQSFCVPGEPLAGLGVVARVVSDRLLGIGPGMALLTVDDER